MDKKYAPFTKEEVEHLKKFTYTHPFTCCSPDEISDCQRRSRINEGELIPTEEGWVCPCGQYKQNWYYAVIDNLNLTPKLYSVDGWNIPEREMTLEELNREVTQERFMDWMKLVGHDYVYEFSISPEEFKCYCLTYLIPKFPDRKQEIMKILGDKYKADLLQIQREIYSDVYWDLFYKDYAEYINTTIELKIETNVSLILITEHYNK